MSVCSSMRGTKYFCIIIGCILLVAAIFPVPFPLLLETAAGFGGSTEVHALIRDGSMSVNRDAIIAKHQDTSPSLSALDVSQGDADAAAESLVYGSIRRAVSPVGLTVWGAMFTMGIAWIVVGIRIPSRLPVA